MADRRIAFLITELDDGGAERALVQIATGLAGRGWKVSVISLGPEGPLVAPLVRAGIDVASLGIESRFNPVSLWRSLFGLARELRRLQPDLLQTFLFHANIVGRIAARIAGVSPVVSGIRVAERRGRWRLWLDRLTQNLVQKHVCVSQAVADFSVDTGGLDPDRTVVIPNGVDADRFRNAVPAAPSEFGLPRGARVVLSVGRLDEQKNPLGLLTSFHQMAAEIPEAVLLFAGDGPLTGQLKTGISDLNLDDRVIIAGRRSDVPGLMKMAEAFVLASRWEGMPNVILEAGAAGIPVVSTSVEGATEIIEDGVSGVLVGIDDVDALSDAIAALLNDRVRAQQLAGSLQAHIVTTFTWDAVVSEYDRLYESLLNA